ncbi:MAG TPA: transcriptional repressor [Longimicrobiales bacterium]|nr:transcriptional repressor [Longimicrobiales bacterium]
MQVRTSSTGNPMQTHQDNSERTLRAALSSTGQRYTEQRASVFRFLRSTESHPTADEVFFHVRQEIPGISLATVYKSLETLVGAGLASKLTYGDGSARYDGRTDDHHHLRCLGCGKVVDLPGQVDDREVERLEASADGFQVTGCRLELTGYCSDCSPESARRG